MTEYLKINYGAIKQGKSDEIASAIRLLEERVVRGLGPNGTLLSNLPADASINLNEGTKLLRTLNPVAVTIEFAQQAQHQPVGTVTVSGGSGTPTATLTDVDGAELDDGNVEGIAGSIPIPKAWQDLSISCYITWAHSDPSLTGDVTLGVSALPLADGEDDTGSPTVIAQTVEAAASGGDNEDLFRATKVGTIPIGASDELLMYSAYRQGDGLLDDFGAKIWAYTLLLINDN